MSVSLDRSPLRRRAIIGVILLTAALTVRASAQQGLGERFRLPEGERAYPPRYPARGFEDGSFMVCKLQYTSVRREAMGMGWSTDYPYAGINLMIRMSELTRTPITKNEHGEPTYWVVRLTDDALFRCLCMANCQIRSISWISRGGMMEPCAISPFC